jgi:predicted HTH domain antitoxin
MSGQNGTTQRRGRTVTVKIPREVAELLAPSQEAVARLVLELALVELFRRGEVSSGWAAERLGIGKWDFIQILGRQGVPYVDMTPEELQQDLQVARAHAERVAKAPPPPSAMPAS